MLSPPHIVWFIPKIVWKYWSQSILQMIWMNQNIFSSPQYQKWPYMRTMPKTQVGQKDTFRSSKNNFLFTFTGVVDNDIALLQLEKRIRFSDYVYPVCLAEKAPPHRRWTKRYLLRDGDTPSIMERRLRFWWKSN